MSDLREFRESGPWRKTDRIRHSICIICGAIEPPALEICRLSSARLRHLLAQRPGSGQQREEGR